MSLDKIEKTSVAEVKQRLHDQEFKFVIPPEHILTGECTWEAFNQYIAQHPIQTIRAREVARMYPWLKPILDADKGNQWDVNDILRRNEGKSDER